MSNSYKKILVVGIVVSIALLVGCFFLTHQPKNASHNGTSVFADIDIVSGEVSAVARGDIVNTLTDVTGVTIQPNDIKMRVGSYGKLYDINGTDYLVAFTVDVDKVKSSFDMSVQYVDDQLLPIAIGCADFQKPGYTCILKQEDID